MSNTALLRETLRRVKMSNFEVSANNSILNFIIRCHFLKCIHRGGAKAERFAKVFCKGAVGEDLRASKER